MAEGRTLDNGGRAEVEIEGIDGEAWILRLEPGDILVYQTEKEMNRDMASAIAERLKELTGWGTVVCVDGGGRLGAIRMERVNEVLAENADTEDGRAAAAKNRRGKGRRTGPNQ